jgi:hypothetical protein
LGSSRRSERSSGVRNSTTKTGPGIGFLGFEEIV